jgi:hypothetical protein
VHPQKPRFAGLAPVPIDGRPDDVFGPSLLDVELELLVQVAVELVVDVGRG